MPRHHRRLPAPMHHHSVTVPSAPPAPTANYLHTTGTQIFDSANVAFQPRGAQWVGINYDPVTKAITVPFTETHPNPTTLHGDPWQLINTFKLNTIRLSVSWDYVEQNAPTLISPGVYKHDWTDNAGVINPNFDTAPDPVTGLSYLGALQQVIADAGNQGVRVILCLHQSAWSPGVDPTGFGIPRWLYTTPTPGATFTVGTQVTVPSNTSSTFNLDCTAPLTLGQFTSTGVLKVTDGVTVFNLNYSSVTNGGAGGVGRFNCTNTVTTGGTCHVSATGAHVPDEQNTAKWEFFQGSGGYARPGIVGPPQDLCADFWRFIIRKFATIDTVVGIDMINEPGWPANDPCPKHSTDAGLTAPTGATLISFYQKIINVAAAEQDRLLKIFENGTYANTQAGRTPISGSDTPPTGNRLVYSWHYYPDNPNNGLGPAGSPPGTVPTLPQITTRKGYLETHRALAQDTFGLPFWVGETSLFKHIENNVKNQAFDYTDTVFDPTNTTYPATQLLWERLWRDFQTGAATNHIGWSIWAFQYNGVGNRSFLNTDGTPKTDFLSAIGATPDPTPAGGVAKVIAFHTVATGSQVPIFENVTNTSDTSFNNHLQSLNWLGLYKDQGVFGRASKTAPTGTYYPGHLEFKIAGGVPTFDAVKSTGGTPAGDSYAITNVGAVYTITFNCKVDSIKINGDVSNPQNLIVTGLLWVVNPAGDKSGSRADYNALFDVNHPAGQADFENCTPWFQNFYGYGASGSDPMLRFNNCRAHPDGDKPYLDGFFLEAITRDGIKGGKGCKNPWFRHGTIMSHPYAKPATDSTYPSPEFPTGIPVFVDTSKQGAFVPSGGPVTASISNPPLFSLGETYAKYQVVASDTTKTPNKYWSAFDGNSGNLLGVQQVPPLGLGGSDANWEYIGDTHSDAGQFGDLENDAARPVYENVFWYQTNHCAIFCQGVGDNNNHAQIDKGVYNPLYKYKASYTGPDMAKVSSTFYRCISNNSGNAPGTSPSFWTPLVEKSTWSSATTYHLNDKVVDQFGTLWYANTTTVNEDPSTNHFSSWTILSDTGAWGSGKSYVSSAVLQNASTNISDTVRTTANNRPYICILDSDNPDASLGPGNATYWTIAGAYGILARYCLVVQNNLAIQNAIQDTSNGYTDSFFARAGAKPVIGNTNTDTADGVHVTNKRNNWGDNNTPIDGSSTT